MALEKEKKELQRVQQEMQSIEIKTKTYYDKATKLTKDLDDANRKLNDPRTQLLPVQIPAKDEKIKQLENEVEKLKFNLAEVKNEKKSTRRFVSKLLLIIN